LFLIQFVFRANANIIQAATNIIINNNNNNINYNSNKNISNNNNKLNWQKPDLEEARANAKVKFIVSKSVNLIFNNLINVLFLFC